MASSKSERTEALARLREWIKPGDTVHTVLRHVSRSGMQREIGIVLLKDGDALHPNYAVAAATGYRLGKRDGIIVGGCGMDMGFHLVYQLSEILYGAHLETDIYLQSAKTLHKDGTGPLLTREGAPEGKVWVGGYRCLGKGEDGRLRCPSSYHVNHHDQVRCEGIEAANGDRRRFCYRPDRYGSRWEVPEDWPTGPAVDVGEGQTIRGPLLACLTYDEGETAPADAITLTDGQRVQVCPTCQGAGYLPNPEGPERWDLVHTDGYALRHRWL